MGEEVVTFKSVRGDDIVCPGGDLGWRKCSMAIKLLLNPSAGSPREEVRLEASGARTLVRYGWWWIGEVCGGVGRRESGVVRLGTGVRARRRSR